MPNACATGYFIGPECGPRRAGIIDGESPLWAVGALGIALTLRSRCLVISPALYTVTELETVLDWASVVILMKVTSVYMQVWLILEGRGLRDRVLLL